MPAERHYLKPLLILMAVFVLVVLLMVTLRAWIGKEFEIRNSDILLALIPIAFWLILTGKVKVLEFGGLKIESAFAEAARAAISPQVAQLPVEFIEVETKGGRDKISRLIENKTEALTFQLGHGYFGPMIQEYLMVLCAYPFLQYIVINSEDGKFFGLADAHALNSMFLSSEADFYPEEFARWLDNPEDAYFSRLPGFKGANNAIRKGTNKQAALESMEELNVKLLPVIDDDGRFTGVVDRSRLATSLIIEVAGKVR